MNTDTRVFSCQNLTYWDYELCNQLLASQRKPLADVTRYLFVLFSVNFCLFANVAFAISLLKKVVLSFVLAHFHLFFVAKISTGSVNIADYRNILNIKSFPTCSYSKAKFKRKMRSILRFVHSERIFKITFYVPLHAF